MPSLELSRRRFLASLKDAIAVIKRKIHENTTRLSILFLAGTTGLVPVLLFQCRRRPSFPSWYLKVPIVILQRDQESFFTYTEKISYGVDL